MQTVKLIKKKTGYLLIIPESIAKLYAFENEQVFHLEVKEGRNDHQLIFLTYVTKIK